MHGHEWELGQLLQRALPEGGRPRRIALYVRSPELQVVLDGRGGWMRDVPDEAASRITLPSIVHVLELSIVHVFQVNALEVGVADVTCVQRGHQLSMLHDADPGS